MRKGERLVLAALLVLAVAGHARAAEPEPPPPRVHAEFLEKSYLFHGFPRVRPRGERPLVFEAQLAPHLFLWNRQQDVEVRTHDPAVPRTLVGWGYRLSGLERLLGTRPALAPGWLGALWVDALSFTLQLRLRMVTDAETPARPPSYMPRIDYQLFGYWKHAPERAGHSPTVDVLELRLTPWGHHSNGQRDCIFDRTTVSVDAACPAYDPGAPPLERLNRWSGEMTTNFFLVGAHWARLWLGTDHRERARVGLGLSYEDNPQGFGVGAIDETLQTLYGRRRVEVSAQASRRWTGLWNAEAAYTWISRTPAGIPDWRVRAELSYTFASAGGLGLFTRYVAGQDDLNVLFASPAVHELQAGFVWNLHPEPAYLFEADRRSPQ